MATNPLTAHKHRRIAPVLFISKAFESGSLIDQHHCGDEQGVIGLCVTRGSVPTPQMRDYVWVPRA
jgi:hypothetical protein